jgi:hypothetical protein
MPQSTKAPESGTFTHTASAVTCMPRRAVWGVVGLVALTIGSLGLAWLLPNATLLHFLWVAQAVPVLYLLLAWWGIQPSETGSDAP